MKLYWNDPKLAYSYMLVVLQNIIITWKPSTSTSLGRWSASPAFSTVFVVSLVARVFVVVLSVVSTIVAGIFFFIFIVRLVSLVRGLVRSGLHQLFSLRHISHFDSNCIVWRCILIIIGIISLNILIKFHPDSKEIWKSHKEEETDTHANRHSSNDINIGKIIVTSCWDQSIQFCCQERALWTCNQSRKRLKETKEQLLGLVVHETIDDWVIVEVAGFIGAKTSICEVLRCESINSVAKGVKSVEIRLVGVEISWTVVGSKTRRSTGHNRSTRVRNLNARSRPRSLS